MPLPFASAVIVGVTIALCATNQTRAAELDDLLNDTGTSATLAESEGFQFTWNSMLDDLSKREYPKADASLKKLESERGYVSPKRRDCIRLAGRVLRFGESLEGDKKAFRNAFNNVTAGVSETESAIKALQLEAAAAYKRHNSLPPLTKENLDKRYKNLQELLTRQRASLAAMKEEARDFEAARVAKLESEIAEWIGKEQTAEDVVTGLVLANAYLDRVGNSERIRALSQELNARQLELDKVDKIVAAVAAEIEPLTTQGNGDEAQARLAEIIAKVESSNQSAFLKMATVGKLRALRIKVAASTPSGKPGGTMAAAEAAELGKRLDTLEKKLDSAQASFGTLVRSIDGFSEFSSDFTSESDWGNMTTSLREKLKTGQVSKEKMDNMVKARAEHAGILREVEILQAETVHATTVQKARLADLQTTATTALKLLDQATP